MSLYDQVGGNAGMKAAVAVFYNRVTADDSLAPWFEGVDLSRLKAHQRAFLAAALGGPELFAGRELELAHAGLDITPEAFDSVVQHLTIALHDLGATDHVVAEVRERVNALRERVVVLQAASD
ncbi:hemoglobin [Microbacteriaceae bacterium SG_E_30_P1]|uniref:Group 1 truncated hemoglobin n=1 Tax=Antiquaquibacter oligotrophicus TaxID=2880260 RepID=A0ABT6KIV3_9MICO|nr:group 1 truncated hemoglobin [Antiquaquibacter oligotrophicus]MDH6179880.1 hemoglobin [Antiquaquibacter oligotrophicus]UDF14359.1 group 1 truncated hemoglobin [Antiquaquibacter oligotrophicus]